MCRVNPTLSYKSRLNLDGRQSANHNPVVRLLRAALGAFLAFLLVGALGVGPAAAEDAWTQQGDPVKGSATNELFGKAISLSDDGLTMAVGNDPGAANTGEVKIYDWDGDSWEQRGSTITGGGITRSDYGVTVSLSADGNTVAIGDPTNDTGATQGGLVQVWTWNGTAWGQLGSDMTGSVNLQNTGASLSLSGDGTTVAAGGPGSYDLSSYPAGTVKVWKWSGTAWGQLGSDITAPSGSGTFDLFGSSVSLAGDGTTLAVSSYDGLDKVWTFEWDSTSWSDFGGVISETASAVALSSDGAVLGLRSNSGAQAYVLDSNTWIQRGSSIPASGNFSRAKTVALSDDGSIFAVGSPYAAPNGTQSGRVQVFEWSGADWSQKGDDLDGSSAGEIFGGSVALSANGLVLAVGAYGTNDVGTNAGQAFAYAWPVPPATGDAIPGPATYFSYFLPDGRECTSISPQRVQVGTFVNLPGEDALCRTSEGSLVAGWTIPVPAGFTGAGSSSLPLSPGHRVRVIESQRFTVVPFEPMITVEYDANIASEDACTPANMAFASDDGRMGHSWVPRSDIAMARTWSQAPCVPQGYELVGWNTRGDGSGQSLQLDAPLPESWGSSMVNERRLFAVWRAT